jgi:hypothetical protein
LEPLGIEPGPDADRALDARAAELDAAGSDDSSNAPGRIEAPAIVMLGAGALALVAGLILGEAVATAIGAILTAAGVYFVTRGFLHGRTGVLSGVAGSEASNASIA